MAVLPGLTDFFGITAPSTKNTWSADLGRARDEWSSAREGATSNINQGRASYQDAFSPFAKQFSGMAQPFGDASMAGLEGFTKLLQDPNSITTDPLYQARMKSGTTAIENSASARGMQLSGSNLLDLGNFASETAASTLDQRMGQFGQMQQMGQQGLLSGFQGMGQIQGGMMDYDRMMNEALYGAAGGISDTYGAEAQASSAAQLGAMNAQAQTKSGLFGAAGMGVGAFLGM